MHGLVSVIILRSWITSLWWEGVERRLHRVNGANTAVGSRFPQQAIDKVSVHANLFITLTNPGMECLLCPFPIVRLVLRIVPHRWRPITDAVAETWHSQICYWLLKGLVSFLRVDSAVSAVKEVFRKVFCKGCSGYFVFDDLSCRASVVSISLNGQIDGHLGLLGVKLNGWRFRSYWSCCENTSTCALACWLGKTFWNFEELSLGHGFQVFFRLDYDLGR